MPRDWDARTYDRVADPMTRWGAAVLDRLPLDGDERVLDAGCGSGRVTELLAERLPRGRVVALDGSPAMVEAARERLARFGDRIEYVVADLGAPLPIDGHGRRGPLDRDLPLGARPRRAVPEPRRGDSRPAAGSSPSAAASATSPSVQRVLATIGDGWLGPRPFRDAAGDRRAGSTPPGYVDIECWLTDEPTRFEPGEPFETYLRTVVLGAHLERLPPEDARRLRPRGRGRHAGAAHRLRPPQHRRAPARAADRGA